MYRPRKTEIEAFPQNSLFISSYSFSYLFDKHLFIKEHDSTIYIPTWGEII